MNNNQSVLPRPKQVSIAVKLLYACIGVGVLIDAVALFQAVSHYQAEMSTPLLSFVVGAILGLGLLFLLAYKIAQRRNWARVIFFILFCFSLVTAATTNWQNMSSNKLGFGGLAVQILLQLIAVVLLLSRDARAWFAGKKEEK